jgi:hypothetical protein
MYEHFVCRNKPHYLAKKAHFPAHGKKKTIPALWQRQIMPTMSCKSPGIDLPPG